MDKFAGIGRAEDGQQLNTGLPSMKTVGSRAMPKRLNQTSRLPYSANGFCGYKTDANSVSCLWATIQEILPTAVPSLKLKTESPNCPGRASTLPTDEARQGARLMEAVHSVASPKLLHRPAVRPDAPQGRWQGRDSTAGFGCSIAPPYTSSPPEARCRPTWSNVSENSTRPPSRITPSPGSTS